MKAESQDHGEGKAGGLAPREIRICPICGAKFSAAGDREFCPVCMLRHGLAGGVESGESSAFDYRVELTPEQAAHRFEHYQVLKNEDGTPIELGHGAMGVTYKAVDVHLQCPVP